ncbi:MAG: hypothetical protein ACI4GV_05500 [Acutalibacteraceae bacterium]
MKKATSFIMATLLCAFCAQTAFAANISQDSDSKSANTQLTAFKSATYEVVIPESAIIDFDKEYTEIGNIEYKEGNLEPGAYVTVTLDSKSELKNTKGDYTIDYSILSGTTEFNSVKYTEDTAPETKTPLQAYISSEYLDAAKAGHYEATLTFYIAYTNPDT